MKPPALPRPTLCAIVLCLAGPPAHAACPPIQRSVHVGTDSQCDYDNIQDAIYAATCPETIVVTNEIDYYLQHLIVVGKSLTLTGSTGGCSPVATGTSATGDAPLAQITLDARNDQGGGANNHPVLTIVGDSHITLRNFRITGADFPGGNGGGIDFDGTGSLTLNNVNVTGNRAGNGGGIDFHGSGDDDHTAGLTLEENTLILDNTAIASGGGLRIGGNARLIAIEPQTEIYGNHAPNGDGGGIAVVKPARAYIGSPGYGGLGVIEWNDALNGGGVAITGESDQSTCAQFFTTDPAHPVGISNNSASNLGGALYVQGDDEGLDTFLEMVDFRIDGNVATDGSAIYVTGHDSLISLSHSGINPLAPTCFSKDYDAVVVQWLSVGCAKGVACSEISGNGTRYPDSSPSEGATLALVDYGNIHAHGLQMRNNQAGNLLRITGGSYSSALDNVLLADNAVDQPLVDMENNPAEISISNATIAGNTIAHGAVARAVDGFSLLFSIIDQPGSEALDYTGNLSGLFSYYVLANDASSLPPNTVREGEPDFMDAAHGDYHLLPTSLGVDYAPYDSGIADLDGRNRDVDLPQADNWYGPLDLGAYERQSAFVCDDNADAVFCSGFDQP